jgi:hypothetical protein
MCSQFYLTLVECGLASPASHLALLTKEWASDSDRLLPLHNSSKPLYFRKKKSTHQIMICNVIVYSLLVGGQRLLLLARQGVAAYSV